MMRPVALLSSGSGFLLASVLLFLPAAHAESRWPQWRGPLDSGAAEPGKVSYPDRVDDSTLLWKITLPGKGCSTPAVWDGRIYLTGPHEGKDAASAYDWSGKLLWTTTFGQETAGKHRNGSGSNPSPVTDGKRLFVYFKSGGLAALDLDGKVLWQSNLQERFGKVSLYWDLGNSPVLTKRNIVVAVMHGGASFLVAFDQATGEQVWKTERQYQTPVENDHGYTTPQVISRDGREILVTWGAEHLTGHDAADGKLLWECAGFNPDGKKNWVAVASAVISGDLAVVPYGRGSHLAGIRLTGGSGDVTTTHRVWTRDGGAFVPTPAVRDGRVFLVGDRGAVECFEAATGQTLWKGEFPRSSASYYSSPTVAGDLLYAVREDGVLQVGRFTETGFAPVSENPLGERIIATPVTVDGHLLLRGESHLFMAKAGGPGTGVAGLP